MTLKSLKVDKNFKAKVNTGSTWWTIEVWIEYKHMIESNNYWKIFCREFYNEWKKKLTEQSS